MYPSSRVFGALPLFAPLLVTAMRISTYNLRFDSIPNNITVQETIASLPDPLEQPLFLNITKEQPWSTRRIRVAESLLSEDVVISGEYLCSNRQNLCKLQTERYY